MYQVEQKPHLRMNTTMGQRPEPVNAMNIHALTFDLDDTLRDKRPVLMAAVQYNVKYHYTWLVRFCHPAGINSYREHSAHVDFADKHLRPVAGERISIDYQTVDPPAFRSNHVEDKICMDGQP